MTKKQNEINTNANLDKILENISNSIQKLFAAVAGHDEEKAEIRTIWNAMKESTKQMNEPTVFIQIENGLYNFSNQLMPKILSLAKHAESSFAEKFARTIDSLLTSLYNFFFTGAIVTESCYVGTIPPRSQFNFFSSPPPAAVIEERLKALTVRC